VALNIKKVSCIQPPRFGLKSPSVVLKFVLLFLTGLEEQNLINTSTGERNRKPEVQCILIYFPKKMHTHLKATLLT
jgi:hypothetical protein